MKGSMQKQRKHDSSMRSYFEKRLLDKRTTLGQHRNKSYKQLKKLRKSNF